MSKTTQRIIWGVAVVGLIVGFIGIFQLLTQGERVVNYGSYIPWGLWVAAYVYLVGLSAGSFVVGTLPTVFNVTRLRHVTRLALLTSLATILGALILVWLDLGHIDRFWRLFTNTQLTSMMGWMSWFYLFYVILVTVMLWYSLRDSLIECAGGPGFKGWLCKILCFGRSEFSDERGNLVLKVLGIVGLFLVIAFSGAEGALFGVVGARAFWHGGLTPIMFLAGAAASGTALIAFITAAWGSRRDEGLYQSSVVLLGKMTLGALIVYLLFEWAEFSIGLLSSVPSVTESIKLIMFGEYWWVFWIIHLLFGGLVPILLLSVKGNRVWAVGLAGALVAVTFLTVRLNIVLPGLSIQEIEGLADAFHGPGLSFTYFPSLTEWLVFIWAVSLSGLVFLAGFKFLPIVRQKEVA